MKKYSVLILWGIICIVSCQKDVSKQSPVNNKSNPSETLSLSQVKEWYNQHQNNLSTTGALKNFNLHQLLLNWDKAGKMTNSNGNWWVMALPGQPTFQGVKQGYRKLAFYRDSTQAIRARILEIIPDAAYIHQHKVADTRTFTGHVFFYDEQYKLTGGRIFHDGSEVGEIVPKMNTGSGLNVTAMPSKIALASENCDWQDGYYIDSEGVLNIYSYQVCTEVNDDLLQPTEDRIDSGSNSALGNGGGGGGDESSAPEISDLPQQVHDAIDPKAYMKCFESLPDIGSKETVTVYVVEPQPGMPFNVGVNSVGHTAISLSKTYNGQTITQTVGFYPTDRKMALTGSPSRIVDNSDLGYDVSVTYNVQPFEFDAIVQFIANPPTTYTLYSSNCTNFAYQACKAANITLPDPTGNVGLFQTGMIPEALASSIKNAASVLNANLDGGIVNESHGPCN